MVRPSIFVATPLPPLSSYTETNWSLETHYYMLTEIISTEFDKCRALKTWTRKGFWSRYFGRGLCGKSRKQEHERKNETRCEILRNEKNDEWEVQNIESAELNKHLAAFIRSVRRKDGEDYEPSRLRCFVSSIQRHLKKNNYTKIINDKECELFRKYLQAKQWELKKASRGEKRQSCCGNYWRASRYTVRK